MVSPKKGCLLVNGNTLKEHVQTDGTRSLKGKKRIDLDAPRSVRPFVQAHVNEEGKGWFLLVLLPVC